MPLFEVATIIKGIIGIPIKIFLLPALELYK